MTPLYTTCVLIMLAQSAPSDPFNTGPSAQSAAENDGVLNESGPPTPEVPLEGPRKAAPATELEDLLDIQPRAPLQPPPTPQAPSPKQPTQPAQQQPASQTEAAAPEERTEPQQPPAQQTPAQPQQTPAQPQQTPAQPQQTPAQPQQTPAQPQQSPAQPQSSSRQPAAPDAAAESADVVHDPDVQPAAAKQPVAKEAKQDASSEGSSATLLLGRALSSTQGMFDGRKLNLADTLAQTTSPTNYHQAVKAYWTLSAELTRYHFAEQEAQQLAAIKQPKVPQERAMLAAALAGAEARQRETKVKAVAAQYDLAERLGLEEPVLPADNPFVGRYRTRFDELFVNRAVPNGVRRIHYTLPLQKELIDARAAAVTTAETALDQLLDIYHKNQAPLAMVLNACETLRQRRNEFVQTVHHYNDDIADYAMIAVGPNVGRMTVVAMLIKTKPAEPLLGAPVGNVAPATATAPIRQDRSTADDRPTLDASEPLQEAAPGGAEPVEPRPLFPLQP